MGVSYVPHFPRDTWLGWAMAWIFNKVVYLDIVQMLLAPADYWYDPQNHSGYLKNSRFLAEANNQVNFDQARKEKWTNLKYAKFIKWERDTTIIPRESAWWGQYTSDLNVINRFETEVYKQDLIGIRTLEESGRAEFASLPGDHMHFTYNQINFFCDNVFRK